MAIPFVFSAERRWSSDVDGPGSISETPDGPWSTAVAIIPG